MSPQHPPSPPRDEDQHASYDPEVDAFLIQETAAQDQLSVDHPLSVTLQVHAPGADPALESFSSPLRETTSNAGWERTIRRLRSWGIQRFHFANAEHLDPATCQELQLVASAADLHFVFSIGNDPIAPELQLPVGSRLYIPVSSDSPRERLDFMGRCNTAGTQVRALTIIDPRQLGSLLDLGSDLVVRNIHEWTISPPPSSADERWLSSESDKEPKFIRDVQKELDCMHIEYSSFLERENSLVAHSDGALFTTDPVTSNRIFLDWLDEMSLSDLLENSAFDLDRHLRSWIRYRSPKQARTIPSGSMPPQADNASFQAMISYDNDDWPEVKELAILLRKAGIQIWIDKWDLQPGTSWIETIDRAVEQATVMLIVIGRNGRIASPNQASEPQAFLQDMESKQCRPIPVILRNAPAETKIPSFLKRFSYVDFRQSDPDPFEQLVWGITGKKPDRS